MSSEAVAGSDLAAGLGLPGLGPREPVAAETKARLYDRPSALGGLRVVVEDGVDLASGQIRLRLVALKLSDEGDQRLPQCPAAAA